MAKKKMTPEEKLTSDLSTIIVPFDLFTGLSIVIEELKKRKFTYTHLNQEALQNILWFKTKEQKLSINIEKENLLIRQFSSETKTTPRKLKVIYVVKPTERDFKLI